jgi:hypothetical protein
MKHTVLDDKYFLVEAEKEDSRDTGCGTLVITNKTRGIQMTVEVTPSGLDISSPGNHMLLASDKKEQFFRIAKGD